MVREPISRHWVERCTRWKTCSTSSKPGLIAPALLWTSSAQQLPLVSQRGRNSWSKQRLLFRSLMVYVLRVVIMPISWVIANLFCLRKYLFYGFSVLEPVCLSVQISCMNYHSYKLKEKRSTNVYRDGISLKLLELEWGDVYHPHISIYYPYNNYPIIFISNNTSPFWVSYITGLLSTSSDKSQLYLCVCMIG